MAENPLYPEHAAQEILPERRVYLRRLHGPGVLRTNDSSQRQYSCSSSTIKTDVAGMASQHGACTDLILKGLHLGLVSRVVRSIEARLSQLCRTEACQEDQSTFRKEQNDAKRMINLVSR